MSTGMLAVIVAAAVAAILAALWLRARVRVAAQREEIRRLEGQVGHAEDAREAFFDLVTHELRSPLSAILGYQELLADGAYGELDDGAADAVDRVGRSARHLLHLIDGVVELSRLRTGALPLELGSVDLGGLIPTIADAFRTIARERNLVARVHSTRSLPTIQSDQDRLVRAFDLLITSAVKHAEGPEIGLDIEAEGDGITARISPIAIEVRTVADDPAVRIGIRLAVAEALARRLGGRLDLEGEQEGVIRAVAFHIRDRARGASPPL